MINKGVQMNIVKVNNGEIINYSIKQLKRDNPNVSFPHKVLYMPQLLQRYNCYQVVQQKYPQYDKFTQKVKQYYTIIDGKCMLKYSIIDLSEQQIRKNKIKHYSRLKNNQIIEQKKVHQHVLDGGFTFQQYKLPLSDTYHNQLISKFNYYTHKLNHNLIDESAIIILRDLTGQYLSFNYNKFATLVQQYTQYFNLITIELKNTINNIQIKYLTLMNEQGLIEHE